MNKSLERRFLKILEDDFGGVRSGENVKFAPDYVLHSPRYYLFWYSCPDLPSFLGIAFSFIFALMSFILSIILLVTDVQDMGTSCQSGELGWVMFFFSIFCFSFMSVLLCSVCLGVTSSCAISAARGEKDGIPNYIGLIYFFSMVNYYSWGGCLNEVELNSGTASIVFVFLVLCYSFTILLVSIVLLVFLIGSSVGCFAFCILMSLLFFSNKEEEEDSRRRRRKV